jgi:cobyrinic acid a,c-diamide synthase
MKDLVARAVLLVIDLVALTESVKEVVMSVKKLDDVKVDGLVLVLVEG